MENSDTKNGDSSQCVRVAVNIRPLITPELMQGCTDCISVVPGEPQVQIGSHAFTYDYVYGCTGLPSSAIYDDCVGPLIDALFYGYNATVLAYGQTGSGKTYTMGTNYTGEESSSGIIPKVMENVFNKVEALKANTEFLIRVSFIEIFKEEVFDLLDPSSTTFSKHEGLTLPKPTAPARVPIQIRETVNGGITLAGVTEAEVRTKEEMASHLTRGSLSRATGSTNMNSQSSRSHAIFTITIEQRKVHHCLDGAINDDIGDDILSAKLHLVDLAGSERAKRTGADGMRFKEGIHINKGLLALGNVISALGDEKKRKEGGHVPYRDSKLTRLLQDSLGGNSKTVMIACVSPADTNAEETLNTLKYANRARNIQNKAIINRDPMAAELQRMRSQIEHLQTELLFYRGDASTPYEELQILKSKVSLLEASNAELRRELQGRQVTCEHLAQCALDAQVEKDKLVLKIESVRNGKPWDEVDSNLDKDYDLLKNYALKVQELEREILRMKNLSKLKYSRVADVIDSDDDDFRSKNSLFPPNEYSSDFDSKVGGIPDMVVDDEKEREYSSVQEKLDRELKELDKQLEQKEAEMKHFTSGDTSVLKQHYDKKVHELELEKRALQKHIDELKKNLANISSTCDDGSQKLKENYLQKLNGLETQVAELKKKQDAQAQLLRQKQKSDEAAKRLQDEIQRIKSQKVQLQNKIKQESEQFRLWKASREKEVLQLKKEGRRNEYEMHKLMALNQRQKMVLQRKSEEAAMATKRLKELLESRKASSRETFGSGGGPGIQALMQTIEHELEVIVRVHEVRSEYDRQIEERARMAKEISRLKEEAELLKQTNSSDCPQAMSPGARNSRIFALQNMLDASTTTVVSMASQLSEAGERERAFSGRGRWNQVRSLPDAKNVMNYLFDLASSSRCLLRDREAACREKDSEIRDLKEKVVSLSSMLRRLETQKGELIHQNSALKKYAMKATRKSKDANPNIGGHKYALRKQDIRNSIFVLEDMDISESENSDMDATDDEWVADDVDAADDEWVMSGKHRFRKRNSKTGNRSKGSSHQSENDSVGLVTENLADGVVGGSESIASGLCCSCSKFSYCKTTKCQCRSAGGFCGPSCGCVSTKCANREVNELLQPEIPEVINETEKNSLLASQGAMLLQSALVEKPEGITEDNETKRKPLSDIGNTVAKSNAPKPNQRRKWRKSTIQLVTNPLPAPPPSAQLENNEAPKKPENNNTSEADIPIMKLPRAMRSAASNGGNLFRDRNASKSDASSVNKDTDAGVVAAPRSPVRQNRTSEEKENFGV